jgi:hypothetical protein
MSYAFAKKSVDEEKKKKEGYYGLFIPLSTLHSQEKLFYQMIS